MIMHYQYIKCKSISITSESSPAIGSLALPAAARKEQGDEDQRYHHLDYKMFLKKKVQYKNEIKASQQWSSSPLSVLQADAETLP